MRLNVVDMFSGSGGLSLGLAKAGFSTKAGIDLDQDAMKTFGKAHPSAKSLCMDASEFLSESDSVLDGTKVDVLVGGPPCQGFCAINPNRSVDDPRNLCIDYFLNAVKLFKPTFVLMENVTGLLSLGKGFALKQVCQTLSNESYFVSYKVLQAAHYGVPQSRWRLFVAASLISEFDFPEPTHRAPIRANFARGRAVTFSVPQETGLFDDYLEPTTVADAISDMPPIDNGARIESMKYTNSAQSKLQELLRKNSKRIYNHSSSNLGDRQMQRVMALSKQGMNWLDLPSHLIPDNLRRLREKYGSGLGCKSRFGRLSWSGQFTTILTQPHLYWGSFIHPEQHRVLSVREEARAQTFPDKVRFYGSISSQYRQVGNAVPPMLAEVLGHKIKRHLAKS